MRRRTYVPEAVAIETAVLAIEANAVENSMVSRIGCRICLVVGLRLALSPGYATAQRGSLKNQLVGAWTYGSSTAKLRDGSPQWGTNPNGLLIFTDSGHFSWQVFRSDRPRFVSNDRTTGTSEENRATIQGSLAYFGTYSVDEANKILVTRVEGSTFPNSEGEEQRRVIMRLTADELIYVNPDNTLGARVEAVWKRLK
jgi:lipocalin-like protein